MSRQEFYQAKFEYYRDMNFWMIVAVGIFSIGYFFSDCYLLGKMTMVTLLPRMVILLPLAVFLLLNAHTKDYRIMIPMSYVIGHGVMWSTIWACTYLEDLRYAFVGFLIIHFIFLVLGIAAPIWEGIIGQGLLFVDIMIANTFLHYPDYEMMFLLGIPLYAGICVFDIAIERTYKDQLALRMKLEENFKHDMLTGAYNRNVITSLVDKNSVFLCPLNKKVAVAMYDLDKFKKINDTYGHAAGDETLVEVTEAVRGKLLEGECLIRWGGEEFIVVMQGYEGKFEEHAQEFRRAVENLSLPVGKVTISIGVAVDKGIDYQKTIKNADLALYEAKRNGRNQVVMYQEKEEFIQQVSG